MKHVIECISENALHEALVRCWRILDDDFPFFQRQATAAADRKPGTPYQKHKARVNRSLWANERLLMRNLPEEHPLAFLEVLDDYLFRRFEVSAGVSPPPVVLLDGETYVIHRRVLQQSKDTAHASKTGHLQGWLRHHWIFPTRIKGIEIRLRHAPECVCKATRAHAEDGGLNVYVGSFPDGVGPRWLNDDPSKWKTRELTDPEKRWLGILQAFEEACATDAAIVVLPELTVCPRLRRKVQDWLDDTRDHPFLLILPGSFHEDRDGEAFNIAELLNRFGSPVLHHRKLTYSGTRYKHEGITTGNRVELLETPIGLIGIPICLDFCDEGEAMTALWGKIGAEWLLVPAFGEASSISAHLRRAKEFFRKHGTVSVIANQHPHGTDEDHGFVYHQPAKETPRATIDHRSVFVNITPSHLINELK